MTCAFAVRGALRKFPGVEAVDVSLNKGLASVKLKPANAVTPEQLWQAIRKNGYTPKETQVVVRGELVAGQPRLRVPEANRTYELQADPATLKLLEGRSAVSLEGTLTPGKDFALAVPLRVKGIRP